MAGGSRPRLDTRARLVAAAIAEFERVGVAAARVEHICRRAGVTRPTFYAHFPGKEDVLAEIQRRTALGIAREMTQRVEDADSLTEMGDAIVDGLFSAVGSLSPRLRREFGSFFVRKQAIADWEGTPLFDAVAQRFAGARARGLVAPEHEPAALTRWLFVMLFGFLVADAGDPEPWRADARRVLRLLLRGLGPPCDS